MSFTSDGALLVIDDEGVARAYTISVPLGPSGLREWVRAATDLRVATGAIDPTASVGE